MTYWLCLQNKDSHIYPSGPEGAQSWPARDAQHSSLPFMSSAGSWASLPAASFPQRSGSWPGGTPSSFEALVKGSVFLHQPQHMMWRINAWFLLFIASQKRSKLLNPVYRSSVACVSVPTACPSQTLQQPYQPLTSQQAPALGTG